MPVIRSIQRYVGLGHSDLLGGRVVVAAVIRGTDVLREDVEIGRVRTEDHFEVFAILGEHEGERLSRIAYDSMSKAFEPTGQTWLRPLPAAVGVLFERPSHPLPEPSNTARALPLEACSLVGDAPRRVLIVDDNRDAADSLRVLIRVFGIEAHVVYDGESALQAMEVFRPATVILDLGMPGMDGWEVARRIRSEPHYRDVTLIALTGWCQQQHRSRSSEAGFDHHLIKPVDMLNLKSLLLPVEHGP